MSSLGNDAYCGTLNCNKLVAKNVTPSDPHKITGDLEVTGNVTIDGNETVKNALTVQSTIIGNGGAVLLNKPVVGDTVGINFNDLTQSWDITADAPTDTFGIGHTVGGSASVVAEFKYDSGTGNLGVQLPATPLTLVGVPTASTGLASGTVWSNAGVLNIIP